MDFFSQRRALRRRQHRKVNHARLAQSIKSTLLHLETTENLSEFINRTIILLHDKTNQSGHVRVHMKRERAAIDH